MLIRSTVQHFHQQITIFPLYTPAGTSNLLQKNLPCNQRSWTCWRLRFSCRSTFHEGQSQSDVDVIALFVSQRFCEVMATVLFWGILKHLSKSVIVPSIVLLDWHLSLTHSSPLFQSLYHFVCRICYCTIRPHTHAQMHTRLLLIEQHTSLLLIHSDTQMHYKSLCQFFHFKRLSEKAKEALKIEKNKRWGQLE